MRHGPRNLALRALDLFVIALRGVQQQQRVPRGSSVDHDDLRIGFLHDPGKGFEHGDLLRTRRPQILFDILHILGAHAVFTRFGPHLVFIGFQHLGLVDAAHVQTCGDSLPVIDMVGRVGRRKVDFRPETFQPQRNAGRHGRFADAAFAHREDHALARLVEILHQIVERLFPGEGTIVRNARNRIR